MMDSLTPDQKQPIFAADTSCPQSSESRRPDRPGSPECGLAVLTRTGCADGDVAARGRQGARSRDPCARYSGTSAAASTRLLESAARCGYKPGSSPRDDQSGELARSLGN